MPYLVSRWRTALHPAPSLTENKRPQQRLSTRTSNCSVSSTRTRGDPELFARPTPCESVDWVERMQSFPTEGRSQHMIASTNMGTSSCAEALRRRSRDPLGDLGCSQVANGGILVVTEVRRESIPDPDYRPELYRVPTEVLGQQYREEDALSILQV